MTKLETLNVKEGRRQKEIKINLNPSFSFQFEVPSLISQKLRKGSSRESPKETILAQSIEESENEESENGDSYDSNTRIKVEESNWEDLDIDQLELEPFRTSAVGIDDDEEEEEEEEGWHEDLHGLPDDFPVLVVNLSKLARAYANETSSPPMENPSELFPSVKAMLQEHFTSNVEKLFAQNICIHATYGSSDSCVKILQEEPSDQIALVNYPTTIDGIPLYQLLEVIERDSLWDSVRYLKECLRKTSRDLHWKAAMAEELELLAEREAQCQREKEEYVSARIDQLYRLRNAFQDRLNTFQKEMKPTDNLFLRKKIQELDREVLSLIEEEQRKNDELVREQRCTMLASQSGEMNLLDMVVAMVLERFPREAGVDDMSHFQTLSGTHERIRRLWIKDFGKLPDRNLGTHSSSQAEQDGTGLENEVEEENDYDDDDKAKGTRSAQFFSDGMEEDDMSQDENDDDDGSGLAKPLQSLYPPLPAIQRRSRRRVNRMQTQIRDGYSGDDDESTGSEPDSEEEMRKRAELPYDDYLSSEDERGGTFACVRGIEALKVDDF